MIRAYSFVGPLQEPNVHSCPAPSHVNLQIIDDTHGVDILLTRAQFYDLFSAMEKYILRNRMILEQNNTRASIHNSDVV